MSKKETKPVNKVAQEANLNCKIESGQLYETARKENDKETQARLSTLYNINYEIEYTARAMEDKLELGIRRFQEALDDLRRGCVEGINSCGLLQGTDEEIMFCLGKLRGLVQARKGIEKIYKDIQKS